MRGMAPHHAGSLSPAERLATERRAAALPEQRGIADVDDVAAGVRYLAGRGLAQEHSVALAGYSFDGYLTLMALARHPDILACGVSLFGVLNPRRRRWGGFRACSRDMGASLRSSCSPTTPTASPCTLRRPALPWFRSASVTWEAVSEGREGCTARVAGGTGEATRGGARTGGRYWVRLGIVGHSNQGAAKTAMVVRIARRVADGAGSAGNLPAVGGAKRRRHEHA